MRSTANYLKKSGEKMPQNYEDLSEYHEHLSKLRGKKIKKTTIYIWEPKQSQNPDNDVKNDEGHLAIKFEFDPDCDPAPFYPNYISFWPLNNSHRPKYFKKIDDNGINYKGIFSDEETGSYEKEVLLEKRKADHTFEFLDIDDVDMKLKSYNRKQHLITECKGLLAHNVVTPHHISLCYGMNSYNVEDCDPNHYKWEKQSCISELWKVLSCGKMTQTDPNLHDSPKTACPRNLEELISFLKFAPKTPYELEQAPLKNYKSPRYKLPRIQNGLSIFDQIKNLNPWRKKPEDKFLYSILLLARSENYEIVHKIAPELYNLHFALEEEAKNEIALTGKRSNTDKVYNHFTEVSKRWAVKPLTCQEVDKSYQDLDKKLSKKPLNRLVTSAIFSVMGAMVGAAIGLTVGAVITSFCGGVGAIPGAILGAVKGITLGTTIGLSVSFSMYGLFKPVTKVGNTNLLQATTPVFEKLKKHANVVSSAKSVREIKDKKTKITMNPLTRP